MKYVSISVVIDCFQKVERKKEHDRILYEQHHFLMVILTLIVS